MQRVLATAVGMLGFLVLPTQAGAEAVVAGTLRADVTLEPFGLRFTDAGGTEILTGSRLPPTSLLGVRRQNGSFAHATRARESKVVDGALLAQLETTDPGLLIDLRVAREGDGVIALDAQAIGAGGTGMGAGFALRGGERQLGFGERSNAVDQRGRDVEVYVADGPYQPEEYAPLSTFVPGPGLRPRDDSTYFPLPWMLSTAGYGVLLEEDANSTWHLGTQNSGAWSVEANTTRLRLRVIGGPAPADVLRRFTARQGRQPKVDAPWVFGTWYSPKGGDGRLEEMRRADVPVSVFETYLHYLPCGDHIGKREAVRQRTAKIHAQGAAVNAYFNPMLCKTHPAFADAQREGVLIKRPDGSDYVYRYSSSPTNHFEVSQVDFTHPGAPAFFKRQLDEAIADGFDGWMEDFGEYTPLDAVAHDGSTGESHHNRYVGDYHRIATEVTKDAPRPIANYVRSGYLETPGTARLVWGGDPTTDWGFDGLTSAVRQALSIGTSGVSRWGSDIGGFFALGSRRLTPELLDRWIAFGFVSGIMRNEANGVSLPDKARPQPHEPAHLPVWRRFAKLRTQLLPYWLAADAKYRQTGLPLMRHHALTHPLEPQAVLRDDQFMVGDDLLAAPVTAPGATQRKLYLPEGRWVDLFRSIRLREGDLAIEPTSAELVTGGREVTLPAPQDEIPLLARAGALLPLIPADIDTLADAYDTEQTVGLKDRRDRLTLVAFPRGRSESRFFDDGRVRSEERGKRRWDLVFEQSRKRRIELKAAFGSMAKPFRPRCLTLRGRRVARRNWSYRAGILTARFSARSGRLKVSASCRRS